MSLSDPDGGLGCLFEYGNNRCGIENRSAEGTIKNCGLAKSQRPKVGACEFTISVEAHLCPAFSFESDRIPRSPIVLVVKKVSSELLFRIKVIDYGPLYSVRLRRKRIVNNDCNTNTNRKLHLQNKNSARVL